MNGEALSLPEVLRTPAVIEGSISPGGVDDQVLSHVSRRPHPAWFVALAITSGAMLLGFALIGYTIYTGIGVWGNNIPVAWAFDIINFVFWVGIGHAGTLISAILLLFRARWRNAISRFAEAMTIFAVMCALIFPLIHVGRPWLDVLAVPVSQSARHLAELPVAADLGRVRGEHLLRRVAAVLVPRAGPRLRLAARPHDGRASGKPSTPSSASDGAAPLPTGCTTRRRTSSSPGSPRASCCRCTAWFPSILPCRWSRAGT